MLTKIVLDMRQHQPFHRKPYASKSNSNEYETGVDDDQVNDALLNQSFELKEKNWVRSNFWKEEVTVVWRCDDTWVFFSTHRISPIEWWM